MIWYFVLLCLALLSSALASDASTKEPPANGQASDDSSSGDGGTTQKASNSVFGAGCRWDPTSSNIEQVSFTFRTGQAPPSTWLSDLHDEAAQPSSPGAKLQRRADPAPPAPPRSEAPLWGQGINATTLDDINKSAILDASYHTRLIDVLTFRARTGSFGSSLNSAGCALPAFSERLAGLEEKEGEIVNNYTRTHKRTTAPSAMFFWAGISNYDPKVRADLIQTVVFYGDGCAAPPKEGLCVYAAEYSNFRYSPEDHMCMGSNMPVFYPIETPMNVIYRTQNGFRTQESWIDGKMVSYLRSAGDQVMNSFVITQECKGCEWPLTEQVYSNITVRFSEEEKSFDKLGLCTGGAVTTKPRTEDGGKVWFIEEVKVPKGKNLSGSPERMAGAQQAAARLQAELDMKGEGRAGFAKGLAAAEGDKAADATADAKAGVGNGGAVTKGAGGKGPGTAAGRNAPGPDKAAKPSTPQNPPPA